MLKEKKKPLGVAFWTGILFKVTKKQLCIVSQCNVMQHSKWSKFKLIVASNLL